MSQFSGNVFGDSPTDNYFPVMGTVNMPKLLRHLRNRTNQVRELTFVRDAIHQKSTKATGATSDTLGTGTALSGPLVSFGYEEDDFSDRTESGDNAYHHDSPGITAGGMIALQTPIISRATRHERTGQRITGECKFYMPTLSQIKGEPTIRTVSDRTAKLQSTLATEETTLITGIFNPFAGLHALVELETFDKLLDKERIVGGMTRNQELSSDANTYLNNTIDDEVVPLDTTRTTHEMVIATANDEQGYEIDRCSFGFRELTGSQNATLDDGSSITIRNSSNKSISYFEFVASMNGGTDNATLRWTPEGGSVSTNSGDTMFHFIDLPVGGVKDGDVTPTPTTGFGDIKNMTASITGGFDTRKMVDSNNKIRKFRIVTTSGSVIFVRNLELYKTAEWRIDSIKEYRDNYQEIKAVRVRGDRMSRRRAYG